MTFEHDLASVRQLIKMLDYKMTCMASWVAR